MPPSAMEIRKNRTEIFSLYSFKPNSRLKKYVDQEWKKAHPVFKLYTLLLHLKEKFERYYCNNENNILVILGDKEFEDTFGTRALHFNQIRNLVLRDIKMFKKDINPPYDCTEFEFHLTAQYISCPDPVSEGLAQGVRIHDDYCRNIQVTQEMFDILSPFLAYTTYSYIFTFAEIYQLFELILIQIYDCTKVPNNSKIYYIKDTILEKLFLCNAFHIEQIRVLLQTQIKLVDEISTIALHYDDHDTTLSISNQSHKKEIKNDYYPPVLDHILSIQAEDPKLLTELNEIWTLYP